MPTPSGRISRTLSLDDAGHPDLLQGQRRREAADAAAGDDYGKDRSYADPLHAGRERWGDAATAATVRRFWLRNLSSHGLTGRYPPGRSRKA